jgi:exodeoxyribonuclease-3
VRLPHLQQWLQEFAPDVVALQETKLEDSKFPDAALAELGYRSVFCGRRPTTAWPWSAACLHQRMHHRDPDFDDPQKRVLAPHGVRIRSGATSAIVDLYVVNGEAWAARSSSTSCAGSPRCANGWREELRQHPNLVVLGDFNIAPDDRDVHDPKRWREKILCSTPEREALRGLLDLGLHDSFRLHQRGRRPLQLVGLPPGGLRARLGPAHRPRAGQRGAACALRRRRHRRRAARARATQRPHAGVGRSGSTQRRTPDKTGEKTKARGYRALHYRASVRSAHATAPEQIDDAQQHDRTHQRQQQAGQVERADC